MNPMAVESSLAAPLMEVFASIQGEGLHVGELQVFVRLRGCPLRCRWCDTPGSWNLDGAEREVRVDARSGVRRAHAWATPFQTACWIAECEPDRPRTVSITGGEPLLWPAYVRSLASFATPRRIHLETAGAHPRALAEVLDVVHHVSLDLKLPDDMDEPVEIPVAESEPVPRTRAEWAETRAECLALVRGRDACAKVIVAGGRRPEQFDELLESVAEHAPDLPVFVQPATSIGAVAAPGIELCTAVAERARALELSVRVLPQIHRILGIP